LVEARGTVLVTSGQVTGLKALASHVHNYLQAQLLQDGAASLKFVYWTGTGRCQDAYPVSRSQSGWFD
jgi:hypothetical protein